MNNKEIRISDRAEELVGKRYSVLDKGYVELVSYHGTDKLIEAAARCSYQKGTRTKNDTEGLIRYLIRHKHMSPVEQCNVTFALKMPLFVIQQVLRHRAAKLNQESFRFSEVSDEFYECTEWRKQSTTNKQGSEGLIDEFPSRYSYTNRGYKDPNDYLTDMQTRLLYDTKQEYNTRLEFGVSRELARKDIPVSTYSKLYWQMDLRNLLHFFSLRCDEHAQLEIREYADAMACITKEIFPITFQAWYDYEFTSINFTQKEIDSLSKTTLGQTKEQDINNLINAGLSKREAEEFFNKSIKQFKFFSISSLKECNKNT